MQAEESTQSIVEGGQKPDSPNFWTDSHVLLSAWESVAAMRSGEMRRTALSRKPIRPLPTTPPRNFSAGTVGSFWT